MNISTTFTAATPLPYQEVSYVYLFLEDYYVQLSDGPRRSHQLTYDLVSFRKPDTKSKTHQN